MFWLTYSRAWYRFAGTCNRARCRERTGSRIWWTACKRSNARSAPSDVAAASRRNLRRLIDSSRQITRCSSIDGCTRLHGKGELSDHDTLCSNYAVNITVYIHIESCARARWMFEFLSLFTLRRSTYCTLLSIVREFPPWTIMHFSGMENRRGVSHSSNNSVFIKFQRRAFVHRQYVSRNK